MKTKNFLIAGFFGGFIIFLLDWLFYEILFANFFASEPMTLFHMIGNCFTFGFTIAYVLICLVNVQKASLGLKYGGIIGLLFGLMSNFALWGTRITTDWDKFALDVLISSIVAATAGAIVGRINLATAPKIRGAIY